VFTPTNPASFTGSTSSPLSYVVNAAGPTTTTTSLNVTPTSPAAHGTSETLTATVVPSGAAGSVKFMDGATQVGTTQTVAAGSATVSSVLADGSHSLTAVFTPTDATAFTASTSTAVPYTVNAAAATTTTTTLGVTPSSPAASGTTETLTATVVPSGAAGSVKFMDGATQVGTTQTVSAGSATVTAVLADGSHSLTAVFTPTDPTAFTASTSAAQPYTVTAAGPVSTTTALATTPASPAASGTSETLTATVTPSGAAGTVGFWDGATQVGSDQPVSGGTASVSAVLADGSHSLTAVFTPTDAAAFSGSTSEAVPYDVTPAGATATTTSLDVTPASPAASGTSETLTATVTPSGAAGTVGFWDGATQVGSDQPVSGGTASVSAVLADGSHSLTAVFTPTDPTAFAASTSAAVDYTVTGVGPVATTTTLDVTPASPAASGATETLTATVTPSGAAGTVDFFDGSTQVGTTQPVSGGTASVSAVLGDGDHSLTAVFTPTDATAYASSTSAEVSYSVGGTTNQPRRTKLHLNVWPPHSSVVGRRVFMSASIWPHWAHGKVEFYSGGRLLGTSKLEDGVAKFSTDDLKVGSHALWAKYLPWNPDNFKGSASNSVRIQILPHKCQFHGHNSSRDASPAAIAAGGSARHAVSFDGIAVASTSPTSGAGDKGAATGVAVVILLGLLVSGAASILTTRRGTAHGRGPTAD
jgi:Bacterial Ig-like domain (group 3)